MKKVLMLLLCLILIIGTFAGCGGASKSSEETSDSAGDKTLTIGFLHHNVGMTPYTTQWSKTFEEYAKEKGIKTIVMDAQGDPVKQSSQMESMISMKPDAIILWASDGTTIVPAMKKAFEAGIPIISTNSPPAEEGYQYMAGHVGPNDFLQGELSVELIAEALGPEGGNIVHITGTPGYFAAIKRMEGVQEALKKYPNIKLIDEQPCNWDRVKAEQVMQDFLTKYPDIDGVIGCTGDLAIGIDNAINASGTTNKISIVGQTMMQSSYDLMESGTSRMFGDVGQSPITEAKMAIDTAIKVANGEKVEQFTWFDTPKILATDVQAGKVERPTW